MTFVKDYIQKVAGHLSDREFQLGMLFVVLLFLLCLLAMGLIRLRRRGRSTIVVSEEGGELVISRRAFADFVKGVVAEFPLFQLVDAWFVPVGGGHLRVGLKLKADASTELTTQHTILRDRLLGEFKARLGVGDKIGAIDMHIASLDAAPAAEEAAPEA